MDNQRNKIQTKNNNKINECLKILQWNCHSLLNKLDSLKSIADEYDIIILSETWLFPEKKIQIKNFNIVSKDRLNNNQNDKEHHGWICILIKCNNKF